MTYKIVSDSSSNILTMEDPNFASVPMKVRAAKEYVDDLNLDLAGMVEDLRKITSLPLDCHLMIVQPEKYVERFAKAGADIITVHYEACKENLKEVLALIKSTGAKCGAVINPDTPVEKIKDVILDCDMVLVMSVFPGFGGQKFIPDALDKLREIRAIIDESGKEIDLEIDGGVTAENVEIIKAAGANVIVAGSAVFNAPDRAAMIAKLKA